MPPKKSPLITYQHAHALPHTSTENGAMFCTYLRSHRLKGIYFRRQHAIGKFIVDFCASRQKLIIELDGSQHLDREEQDSERTSFLASKGYRILRFWNNDVMNDLNAVMIAIEQALSAVENNE